MHKLFYFILIRTYQDIKFIYGYLCPLLTELKLNKNIFQAFF